MFNRSAICRRKAGVPEPSMRHQLMQAG